MSMSSLTRPRFCSPVCSEALCLSISNRGPTPELSGEAAGVLAAVCGIAIVGCVFLHEASHVVVARRCGLAVRSIHLYMFGGYSVIDGTPSARTEFLVSISPPGERRSTDSFRAFGHNPARRVLLGDPCRFASTDRARHFRRALMILIDSMGRHGPETG